MDKDLSVTWIIPVVGLWVGIGLLFWGGKWMTQASVDVARRFRVSRLIIGLTLVAFATSLPELFTSCFAAYKGEGELVSGNILGSNLCNMGLILGLMAWIRPIKVRSRLVKVELPLISLITCVFYLMGREGHLSRMEGLSLLCLGCLYFAFVVWSVRRRQRSQDPALSSELPQPPQSFKKTTLELVFGVLALSLGAECLVQSCQVIATNLGISTYVIGFTLMAVGTSLPELATSLVALLRQESQLSAGNLIGSTVINFLIVGGGTASLFPIELTFPFSSFALHLAFASCLWLFGFTGRILERWEGFLLLVFYFASLYWTLA